MVDFVDILSSIKKFTEIGESTTDKQRDINVSDVWHIWDILVAKYDTIEVCNLLHNFTKDDDLKLILKNIIDAYEDGASKLEREMVKYAIPMPQRPSQSSFSTSNLEVITDRYIFVQMLLLVKEILPILMTAFVNSSTPEVIKLFREHMVGTLKIHDNLTVYGNYKGYMETLPSYRPSYMPS